MASTYELIATTTLSSVVNPIVFTSIPGTFTDLRVVCSLRRPASQVTIRFNNDSTSLYSFTDLIGDGSAVSSGRGTSTGGIIAHYDSISSAPNITVFVPIDILSYAGSTFKTLIFGWYNDQDGNGYIKNSVGLYRSTSAITSLRIHSDDTFGVGSTVSLYGIKNA